MKKIKVSFYILGITIKSLVLLLCIGMISACGTMHKQPKENNDAEVFFSDKKAKDKNEEYVRETKKNKSEKSESKKEMANQGIIGGFGQTYRSEDFYIYNSDQLFNEGKSVYPNLSDYAAADINPKEYLFPNSDIKLIDSETLDNMGLWQLRRGLNEIYARRGRKFINDGQRIYFESKSWYKGSIEATDFEEDYLNEYEKNNVALLQEKLIGCSEGINIGDLEVRVFNFLKEKGANGVLRSKFDQNTLENVLIKDIIYQIHGQGVDYEKIRREAEKRSGYDADDNITAIKNKDLDLLLDRLFGVGLEDVDWNRFGISYSKKEDVYYALYKDSKEVDIISVELIYMDKDRYRFICRERGYEEDNSFLIVELESNEDSFRFISVK
mgnify:CR=1 FL=1